MGTWQIFLAEYNADKLSKKTLLPTLRAVQSPITARTFGRSEKRKEDPPWGFCSKFSRAPCLLRKGNVMAAKSTITYCVAGMCSKSCSKHDFDGKVSEGNRVRRGSKGTTWQQNETHSPFHQSFPNRCQTLSVWHTLERFWWEIRGWRSVQRSYQFMQ